MGAPSLTKNKGAHGETPLRLKILPLVNYLFFFSVSS